MSNNEGSDSLAEQAAAWVPPWERQPRPLDRVFQAEVEEKARAAAEVEEEARAAAEVEEKAQAAAEARAEIEEETRADVASAEPDSAGGDVRAEGGAHGAAVGPVVVDPAADDATWDSSESDDSLGRAAQVWGEGGAQAEDGELGAAHDTADADIAPETDAPPGPLSSSDTSDKCETIDLEVAQKGIKADIAVDGSLSATVPGASAGDDVTVDLPSAGEVVAGEGAPGAQAPTQAEAGSIVGAGRAKAGSAVPGQGRRRRNGVDAGGDAFARTSKGEAGGGMPAPAPLVAGTAEPVGDLPALLDEAELAAALEAVLLVVDEPVAEMQLAQILEQPTERVAAVLENISARYTAAGHGFDLRRAAGGWRLYTRPEYAAYVERFVLDGQSVRLTQAALETLAVVAYKQPVTRSRISAIRGVNCDGVMRTLVTRGLIEECGTESETGAYLYRTTALFLEKLGLNSVDQLPPLAPFLPDDVEEVLDAPG